MTTKEPEPKQIEAKGQTAEAAIRPKPQFARADLVFLLVVAAIWVVWYMPVLGYWNLQWFMKDSYYIHGPLIPIISLMLIWTMKDKLIAAEKRTDWRGLIIMVAAALVRFLGDWGGIVALGSFAFPPLIFGLVWFLFGPRVARLCLFPIGFLLFMCPIPSTILTGISFPLQLWSTVAAAHTMNLLGFQVVRSGVEISTASGAEVMVGQACSGFRLLVTMLAAAAIFTYLFEAPARRKVLLVVLTLPLALLGNAVRVWLLVFVADRWGEEAMHKAHDASGYFIVVLACLLFIGLMRLLECRDSKEQQS